MLDKKRAKELGKKSWESRKKHKNVGKIMLRLAYKGAFARWNKEKSYAQFSSLPNDTKQDIMKKRSESNI